MRDFQHTVFCGAFMHTSAHLITTMAWHRLGVKPFSQSNGNTFHGCIKWSHGNNVWTIIKVQQNYPSDHKHCFVEHWIIQLQMHSNRSNTWTLNTAHSRYLAVTFLRGHKIRPISHPLGRGMGVPCEFRDHIAVVLRSDPDTSLHWRHNKRNGVIFGFCYVWSRYIESLW